MSYDDIAREVGYANRGTAHRTVSKALTERVDEAVEEYREIELTRLDALQAALWDRAMAGEVKSTEAIVRIIDRRIRLLGLDRVQDEPVGQVRSIVVPRATKTATEPLPAPSVNVGADDLADPAPK